MKTQINEDFSPFLSAGIDTLAIETISTSEDPGFLLSCKIENNCIKIHSLNPNYQTYFQIEILERIFTKLLTKFSLPDLTFILDMKEGVHTPHDFPFPVLAYAKNKSVEKVVLIPDFQALTGNQYFHEQVSLGISKWPYHKKSSAAYWMGATSGGNYTLDTFLSLPRTKIVTLSLAFSKFIQARFIPDFLNAFADGEKIHCAYPQYFHAFCDISDAMEYKYQILVDGNTCAWSRFFWQLHSNCLILKQDSANIQWFYRALEPYVHYIPFDVESSNLVEQIEWCKNNDEHVYQIICNAQDFAYKNLNEEMIYLYLYHVLKKHAEMQ